MCGTYKIVGIFFFQAEDGIRDAQESRGLGDVYKRQVIQVLMMLARTPYVQWLQINF